MEAEAIKGRPEPDPRNTLAMVLAGGKGTRLGPLTDWRVKPALPFGGMMRIIDFTLSNCIHSGLRRIAVLTQYKAQSLLRHLNQGWNFLNPALGEFIEPMPAQQRVGNAWFKGTADAVYQNMDFVLRNTPSNVVILAGDHVYKMDYRPMLDFHSRMNADVTVATVPVERREAGRFGVMGIDVSGRVTRFQEKPEEPEGIPGDPERSLASMGIYVFRTEWLFHALSLDAADENSTHDFGRDILPKALQRDDDRVFAWMFTDSVSGEAGYWRDVGTVDSYWQANMELIGVTPQLNLYEQHWPIYSKPAQLPPPKFVFNSDDRRGMAVDSMVSMGSIVSGAHVEESLLSTNVYVQDSWVERSVVLPDVHIHPGCRIRNAVIDKYCVLPKGLDIGYDLQKDRRRFHVTDQGVVLVTPEMLKSLYVDIPGLLSGCTHRFPLQRLKLPGKPLPECDASG